MRTPFASIALCAGVLLLSACDKTPNSPPVPKVEPVQTSSTAVSGSASDTSVPAADTVFSSASAPKTDRAQGGRSNSTLSAAQESNAMPMAGQNNDHSAPIGPAKRASAP